MRVIYDDSQANLAVDIINECMEDFKVFMRSFFRYEDGMERIQPSILRERINRRLKEHGLRIGNAVTHAYNIANNCAYPVYFDTPDEIQQCCTIHINRSLYGEGAVYMKDYDNNTISKIYKLHYRGIREI